MFDLNILCVGQEKPTTSISGNSNIWLSNTNDDFKERKKHYFEIAPLMNFIDGIWYDLRCNENEIAGTNMCRYADNIKRTYPYWINSDNIKQDLRPLIIRDEYFESLRAIMQWLIGESPIKTLMLFCRYQSEDTEIICGSIRLDEFFDFLQKGEILTQYLLFHLSIATYFII